MSQSKSIKLMEWIKRFAYDSPVLFSIIVMVAALSFTEIPLNMLLVQWVGNPAARFWEGILVQGLAGLLLIGLLIKLDLLKQARFTPPTRWKALWLAWPLVIFALLNSSALLEGSLVIDTSRVDLIVLYVGLVLSIGFFEEILGRGVVLTLLLRKWGSTRRGVYLAVLVSSSLFGAAHIINLMTSRLPLLANLTQMLYSFFFAVIFAACVLRNNSIWPMVIMHAAFDFGGRMLREIAVGGSSQVVATNNTATDALITLALTLFLFLYGLYILRKVSPGDTVSEPSGYQNGRQISADTPAILP